ncbi:uncharacterized protein BDR25DRAFT_372781 [Lindgomyces ingoldianus]|uniref:Uncharacterized protein n=1 Tax=Lindgomyces ingoldianus TaxID=673940 RepID=A0ACB6QS40_9PLEO|nr:uncharacterized protein BDR25DRAFT_372781 [Lindgomyces ingoldianus]KAF2468920.1 hypothetical protein BDR25DRAFT_372781 [Lindgomyces ingoldianus]
MASFYSFAVWKNRKGKVPVNNESDETLRSELKFKSYKGKEPVSSEGGEDLTSEPEVEIGPPVFPIHLIGATRWPIGTFLNAEPLSLPFKYALSLDNCPAPVGPWGTPNPVKIKFGCNDINPVSAPARVFPRVSRISQFKEKVSLDTQNHAQMSSDGYDTRRPSMAARPLSADPRDSRFVILPPNENPQVPSELVDSAAAVVFHQEMRLLEPMFQSAVKPLALSEAGPSRHSPAGRFQEKCFDRASNMALVDWAGNRALGQGSSQNKYHTVPMERPNNDAHSRPQSCRNDQSLENLMFILLYVYQERYNPENLKLLLCQHNDPKSDCRYFVARLVCKTSGEEPKAGSTVSTSSMKPVYESWADVERDCAMYSLLMTTEHDLGLFFDKQHMAHKRQREIEGKAETEFNKDGKGNSIAQRVDSVVGDPLEQ